MVIPRIEIKSGSWLGARSSLGKLATYKRGALTAASRAALCWWLFGWLVVAVSPLAIRRCDWH